MSNIDQLAKHLQPFYSRFDVANRLLFTGHSHQAWPDIAREGQLEYFDLSARDVDNKWEISFEKTEILRNYLREYYDDPDGFYCREENTHFLLVSLLSSFDLKNKPKIITTDAEFHSMYRQLTRLEEEGLQIIRVPIDPDEDFVNRIVNEIDNKTSAIMLSRVYFETSLVNTHLSEIAAEARVHGIPFIIDDYHGTNVIPLSIRDARLEDCFILIGGYKYLQWGEANCFLRFPKDCELRPAITGWFASFSTLEHPRKNQKIVYDHSDQRFASATYDPSSQFRAAKVVHFFKEHNLTPLALRNQYIAQVGLLRSRFLELDLDPKKIRLTHNEALSKTGGFMSLTSPKARELRANLLTKNIFTDARNNILRFGPAPYTVEMQINEVMLELKDSVEKIL